MVRGVPHAVLVFSGGMHVCRCNRRAVAEQEATRNDDVKRTCSVGRYRATAEKRVKISDEVAMRSPA